MVSNVGPVASRFRDAPRREDLAVREVLSPRLISSLARHPLLTTVEMNVLALVRAKTFPTTFVTGSKKDGHSSLPPEGGSEGSLTVRRAVDAIMGSP